MHLVKCTYQIAHYTGLGRDIVIFFIVAPTVLWFSFAAKTVLITYRCFSCC